MIKQKTRWKRIRIALFEDKNRKFFCDEIGWFKVIKVQQCKEFYKYAETLDENHWFTKERVFIKTDTRLKYVVPYIWLVFHSETEKGNLIWKVLDGKVKESED